MTWALYLDSEGKPTIDFYAFCRGKGIISEHVHRADAEKAKQEYIRIAKEEEKRADTQKGFDFA